MIVVEEGKMRKKEKIMVFSIIVIAVIIVSILIFLFATEEENIDDT
jgi:t-SNARE complex subunit (syntaxin)